MSARMIVAVAILALGAAPKARSDSLREAFAAIRPSLPSEGVVQSGECSFSVARAKVRGETSLAEEAAMVVAATAADAALVARSLDCSRMRPSGVTPSVAQAVEERCGRLILRRLVAEGLTTLEDRSDGSTVTVVRGIPTSRLKQNTLDWPAAVAILRREGATMMDAAVAAEAAFLSGEDRASSTSTFRTAVARLHPQWLASTQTVGFGWWRLPESIADRIADLDDSRIIDLLEQRPRDPDLLAALSSRLRIAGLGIAAGEIDRMPRLRWSPDAGDAAAVQGHLEARLNSLRSTRPDPVPRLVGAATVLIATSPSWPASTHETLGDDLRARFDRTPPEQVGSLLGPLLDELASRPSADSASYVSACLLAMGESEASIPFARLAVSWRPDHPYAEVNLLRGLASAGRTADARSVAESLSRREDLDAWAASELKAFLAAPPETPAPVVQPVP